MTNASPPIHQTTESTWMTMAASRTIMHHTHRGGGSWIGDRTDIEAQKARLADANAAGTPFCLTATSLSGESASMDGRQSF